MPVQCAFQEIPSQAGRLLGRLSSEEVAQAGYLLVEGLRAAAGGGLAGFQAVRAGCVPVLAASLGSINIK